LILKFITNSDVRVDLLRHFDRLLHVALVICQAIFS